MPRAKSTEEPARNVPIPESAKQKSQSAKVLHSKCQHQSAKYRVPTSECARAKEPREPRAKSAKLLVPDPKCHSIHRVPDPKCHSIHRVPRSGLEKPRAKEPKYMMPT